MLKKLSTAIKTGYHALAAGTHKLWNRIRPAKPEEPSPIRNVLAREKEEIKEARKSRRFDAQHGKQEVAELRTLLQGEEARQESPRTMAAAAGREGRSRPAGAQEVLKAERAEKDRRFRGMDRDPSEEDMVGLCFSGGGIRSATFNLGITTALAKRGYLKQIDYLSTVSGGGYIGSWLTAWIKRAASDNPNAPEDSGCDAVQKILTEQPVKAEDRYLEPDPVRFLRKYSNYLAPRTGLLSTDLWALLAVYLRNVMLNLALLIAAGAFVLGLPLLAVRYGWRLAGQDLQGSLISATLALLVIAMSAIAYSFASFSRNVQPRWKLAQSIVKRPGPWVVVPLFSAAACMTYVLAPGLLAKLYALYADAHAAVGQGQEMGWFAMHTPAWISALNVFQWLAALPARFANPDMAAWIMKGAFWYAVIWLLGNLAAHLLEIVSQWNGSWKTILKLNWKALFRNGSGPQAIAPSSFVPLLAALLSGALGGLLLYGFGQLLLRLPYLLWQSLGSGPDTVQLYARLALWIMFGLPLLLWTVALVSVLHVGLLGRSFPDAKREWLSRLCAMLALTAAAWLVLTGLAFYGAVVFKFLFLSSWAGTTWGRVLKWLVASGWAGATLAGLIGSNRAKSKPQGADESSGSLLKLAPPIFIVGLLLLLSWGVDACLRSTPTVADLAAGNAPSAEQYRAMVQGAAEAGNVGAFAQRFGNLVAAVTPENARIAMDQVATEHWRHAAQYLAPGSYAVAFLMAGLLLVVALLSWRLDVNEFSIHLLYRNRLVRCYLGASRGKDRAPQPFTGFDVDDDLPLASLRFNPEALYPERSYPGEWYRDLRRPYNGPYPLVCTALNLVSGKELAWQTRKARSFIYSPLFCGYDFFTTHPPSGALRASAFRKTELFSGKQGPFLGTALAISGAAATPNMGYHSSPALTFLMAVFNIRLGWWAGNPRHDSTWKLSGPRLMLYLALELFGRTNDENRFVYLSDGGHFENLGLYELVRRKCRYIIASDAGCDPGSSFSDLGNAIQKCRRDLGAEITIDVTKLRPKEGERLSKAHYALGEIRYADGSYGTLLYLKSSLTGRDRQDVQSFAAEDQAFPHDSTADQFFNETRFESYRALGEDVFESVMNYVEESLPTRPAPATVPGLFAALERLHSGYVAAVVRQPVGKLVL